MRMLAILAAAYVLLAPLGWRPGSTIRYYVNSNSPSLTAEQTLQAVALAAQTWNNQNGDVKFQLAGSTTTLAQTQNGRSEVFFNGILPTDGLCCRTRNYRDSAGYIIESDVWLSDKALGGIRSFFAEDQPCVNGTYVRQILTHEFGHVLGIGHSEVASATMTPFTTLCARDWIDLDPDDINAFRALYTVLTGPPASPFNVRLIS